jgi:hypothetical protein
MSLPFFSPEKNGTFWEKTVSDTPTLARFYSGWKHGGTGEDGMPIYYEAIMIRLDRPPWLSVQREAEPSDFEDHRMAFEMFQKEQAARSVTLAEGYPLTLWPACNEAMFRMLAARDIHTVQQLAQRKKDTMPAELKELAERAAKLVELQGKAGKYEELLRERDGRVKALEESLEEAQKTIMGQKSIIDTLKTKAAV